MRSDKQIVWMWRIGLYSQLKVPEKARLCDMEMSGELKELLKKEFLLENEQEEKENATTRPTLLRIR